MIQVTKDIYCIGGSGISNPGDAAIYLVSSGDDAALVDTGTGRGHRQVISNIKKAGVDPRRVRYIFLSHCHYDHTGGAEQLRNETGARLVAHREDARFLIGGDSEVTAAMWYGASMLPLSIDTIIDESKKSFALGHLSIVMHHTPGHSPGSVVLTTYSENKLVLFGQDVHGPLNSILKSNREQYTRSLKYLLSLEADILCEGHFGVIVGKEEVSDFIESYL